MVSVLYVDFETLDQVRLKDIRLLHKRLLETASPGHCSQDVGG